MLNAIGRAGKSDGSDKEEADQWEHHSRHFTIIVYACSLGAYRKLLDVKIWNYTTYVDYVLKSLRVSNMEEFLYVRIFEGIFIVSIVLTLWRTRPFFLSKVTHEQ